MADPDKKVQPGQRVEFSASGWNAQVEAGRAERARRFDQRGEGPESLRHAEIVKVLNDTTDDLPRRSVLGLAEPLWRPSASFDGFLREVTFRGVVPSSGHVGKYAILLDDAPAGRVARAFVAGIVQVKVDVAYDDHTCADAGIGTTALRSVPHGSAQILWREGEHDDGDSYYDAYGSRLGLQWAIVRMGTICTTCDHTLVVRFGPVDQGGPFEGVPGIVWRLDHVTDGGMTTTTVASGTTGPDGIVLAGYTPTGDGESYVLVYQSPKLVGQGVETGTVEISATVIPPNTHDCRHFVPICPACVEVTGCCEFAYAYDDPTVHVSGGPLTTPFEFDGLVDGDVLDHPGDAFALAHYVVGCVYLPEGTYSVDLTDPDLPPTAAPKPLIVDCVNNPYAIFNDVVFDLDFTPTAEGNPDVSEHLADHLTLSDGTGNDIDLNRPAPAGIPGRAQLWWGCKVFHDIKTVDFSLPASGGQARCDGRYFVAKPACTVNPYDGDRPDLEFDGADVAIGYLFDGCTLTIYALRCEYEQFIPPACDLRSNYQCDELIAALAGSLPPFTPPAPPNGFPEVSTLATLYAKPVECYPSYRWEKTMVPVRPCDPLTDPELFDPVTHTFYFFHYVQNCPVDRAWSFVFYPAGATFVIIPA